MLCSGDVALTTAYRPRTRCLPASKGRIRGDLRHVSSMASHPHFNAGFRAPRPRRTAHVLCAVAGGFDHRVVAAVQTFSSLFPLWVALGALGGLLRPSAVAWFTGDWITGALVRAPVVKNRRSLSSRFFGLKVRLSGRHDARYGFDVECEGGGRRPIFAEGGCGRRCTPIHQ